MTIRCTQRLLKIMRAGAGGLADAHPADDDDWYANLLWYDRRKRLLLTHAGTLFPIFIADVAAADLRTVGELLERNARTALLDEHLPPGALGELNGTARLIARTASKRILGVMTEEPPDVHLHNRDGRRTPLNGCPRAQSPTAPHAPHRRAGEIRSVSCLGT